MPSEADWRRGYHEHIHDLVAEYKAWRGDHRADKRMTVPGLWRSKRVGDLSESEIYSVACRDAEIDMNRAILEERRR